jgi:uncharacterized membrane protein
MLTRRDLYCLLALFALALTARLLHIGSQPFWLDEVITYQRIHLPLNALIADSFANRHFPNYFLMLRWLVGSHAADFVWLRLPSALFGALTAGVVFMLARDIAGRSAGIIAGLLMALSPLQVQYGQEARPYALLVLMITVALWGLLRVVQDASDSRPDIRVRSSAWLTYVAGTLGAMITLGDALPWWLVSNAVLLLSWHSLQRDGGVDAARGFARPWLQGQLLILACCLPFYAAVWMGSDRHVLDNFNWVPQLSWHHLWVVAGSTYLMHAAAVVRFGLLPTAVAFMAPLLALLGVVGFYRLRGRPEGRVLLLGFAVLPLLMLTISLFKPVLVPRYILWSAVPYFVAAGVGGAALGRRFLPAAVVALLALGAFNIAPLYRIEIKPRWDLAAATLSARVQPGDTVYTADPNAPTMLAMLQPSDAVPIAEIALVTSHLDVATARWKAGSRVWAVNGRSAMGVRDDVADFTQRLAPLGTPAEQIDEGREITLLLFPAPTGQR